MYLARFKNRVVMITGASKGIGRAVAIGFAKESAKMVLIGRNRRKLEDVHKTIQSLGGKSIVIEADVSTEKDAIRVFEKILNDFRKVDVLVNNAAVGSIDKETVDIELDEWNRVINTNLRSVFLWSQQAIQIMTKNNYGKIINIASLASLKGLPKMSAYSASKYGLIGLTEAMASEVIDSNININAITPGIVDTEAFRKSHPNYKKHDLMQPEDFVPVVLFLASDEAKCIKGSFIVASNGYHLVPAVKNP